MLSRFCFIKLFRCVKHEVTGSDYKGFLPPAKQRIDSARLCRIVRVNEHFSVWCGYRRNRIVYVRREQGNTGFKAAQGITKVKGRRLRMFNPPDPLEV